MQSNITLKKMGGYLRKTLTIFLLGICALSTKAQTISTNASYTLNSGVVGGATAITFDVKNNNATAISLTQVDCGWNTATTIGSSTPSLWYTSTSLGGAPTIATPAWTLITTGAPLTISAAGIIPTIIMTGSPFIIPAGATYRFAIQSTNGIAYTNAAAGPTPNIFSAAGVDLLLGDNQQGGNVGYGGGFPSPVNTPRFFTGSITFTTGTAACSGAPAPGSTMSTLATVCPTTPFTLSLQNPTPGTGVSFQWQSSPDGIAPYVNIGGATSATYTTTLVASTFYRCNVTCSGSGITTASTPLQVLLTPASGCYCIPGATNCTFDDEILNVKIGGIDNSSSGCTGSGYTSYIVDTGTVVSGAPNPMSVTVGPGGNEFLSVWIDYDHSGTFDASEYTLLGNGNGVTISGNIVIPPTALPGYTRMRVRVRYNTALTPAQACIGYAFGETEDYTLNIVPCIQGVITTQPSDATTTCGADASFTVAATGSILNYHWEYRVNSASPWLNVPNAAPYSGVTTPTLTITAATTTLNGYQYRAIVAGACTAIITSAFGTLTVNPLIATVNPPSATICNGSIQQLSITNLVSAPVTSTFSSGTISVAIPDGPFPGPYPASVSTIPVATIPAGALITSMSVKLNITHTYVGDMVIVLKAPNGNVFNLDALLTLTDNPGINFVNTVISSTGTTLLSAGTAPFTATFKPDAVGATFVFAGFTLPGGPIGYPPNVNSFNGLYSTPNGNWTLAIYDAGAPDDGTLTNWSMDITYVAPVYATGVWGPITVPPTIFTDAAATIPYTGNPVTTVYVQPSVTTNYTVVVSTAICTTPATIVPVTVNNPVAGVSALANETTCENSDVSFTISADSGNTINYTWEVSTDGGATWNTVSNGGVYSGATTSTLTITGATISMNGNMYHAILTVPTCNAQTSNDATLTVNPNPIVVVNAGPYTKLFPGLTTTLTAAVSPNPAATYQWFHDGLPVPGATANTITVDIDGLGDYYATVNDVNGCNGMSNTVTISDSANDILFIYPNPNSGQFQIRYYSLPGNTLVRSVNIYDSKGARVYYRTYGINVPYGKIGVDMSNYSKGVYMVELGDLNGARIKTGRVIIF